MADNNEVSFSDSQTESETNTDSGIQTESISIDDHNVEESVISTPGAISTPVTIKTKEKELSLDDIFEFMKINFNKQSNDFHKRFNSNEITSVSYTHLDVYKRQV